MQNGADESDTKLDTKSDMKPNTKSDDKSNTKSDDKSNGNTTTHATKHRESIAVNVNEAVSKSIQCSGMFMNPAKKQISAFCYLPPPKNALIVGDSRGSLLVFSLMDLGARLMHKPIQILKAMHGREPVSCIKALRGIKYHHKFPNGLRQKRNNNGLDIIEEPEETPDPTPEPPPNGTNGSAVSSGMSSGMSTPGFADAMHDDKYHIVSGGKDGKVMEYTFLSKQQYDELGGFNTLMRMGSISSSTRKSGSNYNLNTMVNEEAIGDGDILMPIRPIASTSLSAVDDIILNENDEMILTGFRSTDFVVWNQKTDYILFRWNCGGFKRPHDFQLMKYDYFGGGTGSGVGTGAEEMDEKQREMDMVVADGNPNQNDSSSLNPINPCGGWMFAYTNTNISNAIAVFHLDFPTSVPLGSLSRPYHSSEIHSLHWLLAPQEMHKLAAIAGDIFSVDADFSTFTKFDDIDPKDIGNQSNGNKPHPDSNDFNPNIAVISPTEQQQQAKVEKVNDIHPIHPPPAQVRVAIPATIPPSKQVTLAKDDGTNPEQMKKEDASITLTSYFDRVMVASAGEDGLIQMLSISNGTNTLKPVTVTTATTSIRHSEDNNSGSFRRRSHSRSNSRKNSSNRGSMVMGFNQKELYSPSPNGQDVPNLSYANTDEYDDWILNFDPQAPPPPNVVRLVRESVMEQTSLNRFPLKCCDMVKKSSGSSYLFFAGGAKEYLQGYEVTFNPDNPSKVEWTALCFTGGDIDRHHGAGKRWKKPQQMVQDAKDNMDLRIKSVVVIPSPKYYHKWLVVTGNSRGTIRAYTFDEERPKEFQFEGEDSVLHKDNNSSSPVLSLTSTYSSETSYLFPGNKTMTNIPFHHVVTSPDTGSTVERLDTARSAPATLTPLGSLASPRTSADRMISGYNTLPPHLIFSGATDGWIRVWFWDIDSHSIQLVERLAIHQSGVNSVSASWLDAKFMKKSRGKTPVPSRRPADSPNLSPTPPPSGKVAVDEGLLTRRLAVLTGGDDQSLTLIVADFESTMSMSRAARKRAKQQRLFKKSMSTTGIHSPAATMGGTFSRVCGWRFNVIREIPVNTAHVASVRSVALTPIVTPAVAEHLGKMMGSGKEEEKDGDNEVVRMNEMLLLSTSDDQRLKCWHYKLESNIFQTESWMTDSVELLEECELDVGLPNSLSMFYVYNKGVMVAVAGQGVQIVTLPFSRYLWKRVYFDKNKVEKTRKDDKRQRRWSTRSSRSNTFESSFSHHGPIQGLNDSNVSGT